MAGNRMRRSGRIAESLLIMLVDERVNPEKAERSTFYGNDGEAGGIYRRIRIYQQSCRPDDAWSSR